MSKGIVVSLIRSHLKTTTNGRITMISHGPISLENPSLKQDDRLIIRSQETHDNLRNQASLIFLKDLRPRPPNLNEFLPNHNKHLSLVNVSSLDEFYDL